jgi:hypothetical protein
VSLALLVVLSHLASAQATGHAQLCVAREKDEGKTTARLVRVWGARDGHAREIAEVGRGRRACVTVAPGTWSLEARSKGFAGGKASDAEACRSATFIVDVAAGATVDVTVAPLGRAPAYYCGWELR